MKKTFTLLFAAAIICGNVSVDAAPTRALAHVHHKSTKVNKARARALAKEAGVKYLPQTQVMSIWDEDAEEWIEDSRIAITYNADGTVCTNEETAGEERAKTEYTYKNGKVTEQISYVAYGTDDWEKSERTTKAYDELVPDFLTENLKYYWDTNDWTLSFGNKYTVERNSSRVVKSVVRLAPYEDNFDPIGKLETTLSDDGKSVTSFKVSEYTYDGVNFAWEENYDLRNIVWHNTDGQTLGFEIEDYSKGNNRIASAESYFEDELEASISGEYKNDFEGTLTFNFEDGSTLEIGREYTDEATGSFREFYNLSYFDYPEDEEDINGDGVFNEQDRILISELESTEITYDEHGNVVREEFSSSYGDEDEFCAGTIYEYTYNEDGAAEVIDTYVYEMDPEERYPEMRLECSDFIALSGIGNVASANTATVNLRGRTLTVNADSAASCSVVALDGRTVAAAAGEGSFKVSLGNVTNGVYLVTVTTGAGSRTSKIVVR